MQAGRAQSVDEEGEEVGYIPPCLGNTELLPVALHLIHSDFSNLLPQMSEDSIPRFFNRRESMQVGRAQTGDEEDEEENTTLAAVSTPKSC